MDKSIRNTLSNVVTKCRKILEESVAELLQGIYGIDLKGNIEDEINMAHLTPEQKENREKLISHFQHIKSYGTKNKEAVEQLIREISFTHLNRLAAYKMLEERKFIKEAVSRGINSKGFKFYLADHKDDQELWKSGNQYKAYENFLQWLGKSLSDEIRALFSTDDPANFLFPSQIKLEQVIELLNTAELKDIWTEDETIGWVYQYFTPKELRKKAREESSAPRNSYELAFRNQFYTPRYVVEFLTDNTLGRTWYEMNQGITSLKEKCKYMVRRPDEVFLYADKGTKESLKYIMEGTEESFPPFDETCEGIQRVTEFAHCVDGYRRHSLSPETWEWYENFKEKIDNGKELNEIKTQDIMDYLFLTMRAERQGGGYETFPKPFILSLANEVRRRVLKSREEDLSQEELLNLPHFIQYRHKKDPRDLKILDPACGSGHFLLYCFDLLLTIYEEAYDQCVIAGSEATKQSLPFSETKKSLLEDYPDKTEFIKAIPGLVLRYNLHGIDIDPRAVQIASLALWMRSQKACSEMGVEPHSRIKIRKSNIVVAEPMPGEDDMLKEFTSSLKYKVLGHMVAFVFEKMKLAGEAGSLLKIEEDIRDEIAKVKKEWDKHYKQAVDKKGNPLLFTEEQFEDLLPVRQIKLDLSDITDEEFWENAEEEVLKALRQYAEKAENGKGFRRKLFAEDAERGFGFIDVLRKRYDVVLMNPPFGAFSRYYKGCKVNTIILNRKNQWFKKNVNKLMNDYPNSYNDIFAAFTDRGIEILENRGMLGVITSRTGFFLTSFTKWRENIVLKKVGVKAFVDLGSDVLDNAMVETAAYCFEKRYAVDLSSFFRVLDKIGDEKQSHLLKTINSHNNNVINQSYYISNIQSYNVLPESPFVYWITQTIVKKLITHKPFEPSIAKVCQGLCTGNDPQFLRTLWEVTPSDHYFCYYPSNGNLFCSLEDPIVVAFFARRNNGKQKWAIHIKSGNSQPLFSPLTLLVNWEKDGYELKNFFDEKGKLKSRPQNILFYFRPGFSWTKRAVRFIPYATPSGSIGSASRYMAFPSPDKIFLSLSFTSSNIASAFMRFYGEWFTRPSYRVDILKALPVPSISESLKQELENLARSEIYKRRRAYQNFEPFHEFTAPITLFPNPDKDPLSYNPFTLLEEELELKIAEAYGLDKNDLEIIERDLKEALSVRITKKNSNDDDNDDNDDKEGESSDSVIVMDANNEKETLISYMFGCVHGRWDIRIGFDSSLAPKLPDPFDPLPVCPPGMLVNPVGLPASKDNIVSEEWLRARPNAITLPPEGSVKKTTITDEEYPIPVKWDGIIVDDPEHPDDIISRIREVIKYLWEENAESIEREACDILGVKSLREYFRKPGKGGFWDDHVKRYSKSRRKAPIYWLLQSSGKNYGLWIYYHRLDKNIFLNARDRYTTPKIRREENRLEDLKTRKLAAGTAGSEAKKLEKELAKQEDLLTELRNFYDKLDKVCNMYLEPDLDDGVIINIAPLWELIPWNDAKKCWEELAAGKYEWSSMSRRLKAKGII